MSKEKGIINSTLDTIITSSINSSINGSNINGYIPNPIVVEQTAKGERQYDIYSRLLIDRIVFLGTEVNDTVANLIIAQMLFLEQSDKEAPIHFYINSPGGGVYAGLGIYDIMQLVSPPVYTYCTGLAASMGALLLQAGDKGHRYSLPHSRIMIHQPLGGARGSCSDIQIQAKEIQDLKKQLNEIMVRHTGKSYEEVEVATDRDNYLCPEEAINFGLIDSLIEKKR
ncbi:MAG: ATP-dependent Clp protease proteolytic subunit [Oligoflexia bacterium]|nr:ATP-dependent Clp protease proteolytic subunit [Oligoflexia bacterium]